MAERPVRLRRGVALAVAIGGAVTDAGYLRLISEQGTGIDGRVTFVVAFIALMSVLALTGSVLAGRESGDSPVALLAASSGFIGIGFVGLFSIGAPLLLCGILALLAVGTRDASRRLIGAAILGPMVVLVAGLVLT